jgi:outer membrane protein assembly factor BamB
MLKHHTMTHVLIATALTVCAMTTAATARPRPPLPVEDATTLGYRVDWMNSTLGRTLRLPSVQGDSVFAIDEEDDLVRIEVDTGTRRWSAPVGNKIFKVLGVNYLPETSQVLITSDGAVYALEAATGNMVVENEAKDSPRAANKPIQNLPWTAGTPSATLRPYLVYGSRSGELVWHAYDIGFSLRTYRIADAIRVEPLAYGDMVVGVGARGEVAVVDGSTVTQLWSTTLLDAVVAPPVIGDNGADDGPSLFIAGTDQYLRSVGLQDGVLRWKTLTSSPLTSSPTLIGKALYQQIPGEGLACFDAFATTVTGDRRWTSSEVNGNVLTATTGGRLIVWDEDHQRIQILETRKGHVVATVDLPDISSVFTNSLNNGDLYLLTVDDAILRLVPRTGQ